MIQKTALTEALFHLTSEISSQLLHGNPVIEKNPTVVLYWF